MHDNFFHKLKVYYEDTDSGGVVYYANYLKYLERARTEALSTIGLSNTKIKNEVLVIDLTNDLTVNSSSKWADFLYSILHDLTIINELNWSWTFLLLKPIENKASVLALSKYFR